MVRRLRGSPDDVLTAVVLSATKTGAEVRVGDKRFALPAVGVRVDARRERRRRPSRAAT